MISEVLILSDSASCPQDGARKSALMEDNNNLTAYQYSDGKTLYEVFQRGLKVSGDESFFYSKAPQADN